MSILGLTMFDVDSNDVHPRFWFRPQILAICYDFERILRILESPTAWIKCNEISWCHMSCLVSPCISHGSHGWVSIWIQCDFGWSHVRRVLRTLSHCKMESPKWLSRINQEARNSLAQFCTPCNRPSPFVCRCSDAFEFGDHDLGNRFIFARVDAPIQPLLYVL